MRNSLAWKLARDIVIGIMLGIALYGTDLIMRATLGVSWLIGGYV